MYTFAQVYSVKSTYNVHCTMYYWDSFRSIQNLLLGLGTFDLFFNSVNEKRKTFFPLTVSQFVDSVNGTAIYPLTIPAPLTICAKRQKINTLISLIK